MYAYINSVYDRAFTLNFIIIHYIYIYMYSFELGSLSIELYMQWLMVSMPLLVASNRLLCQNIP